MKCVMRQRGAGDIEMNCAAHGGEFYEHFNQMPEYVIAVEWLRSMGVSEREFFEAEWAEGRFRDEATRDDMRAHFVRTERIVRHVRVVLARSVKKQKTNRRKLMQEGHIVRVEPEIFARFNNASKNAGIPLEHAIERALQDYLHQSESRPSEPRS